MKTNNCVYMAFLLITTLVLFACPSLAFEGNEKPLIDPNIDLDSTFARSPSTSEYDRDVLNKQSKELVEYAGTCGEMMGGIKCNDEVMSEILQNKPTSRYCCMKMMIYGQECHMVLRNLFFETYYYKPFASKGRPRIPKVWNRCSAEVGGF
ncbi:unnamed protein product [Arabidopsis lyrata]|uniref:Prolamin-like domain-containing protein n=1 Tax=Arabidopsis lyrata subsp. lyrata TaxID=81972 RepID=D7LAI2_ARALL|nr:uncharacterized protein LOC9318262 [Arabidopsis lyrata subsp. lyrata]EFH60549.1 hypothetical protein ARALYDRAFT_896143 [Arabidopsis lyrata subsp. lyrata]CAH8258970.1 unnamed protein product [Arabidopsis lyrata]|eukprot:XP_002884290.1 uncharacterized protein LOC9318262 [Arabidopsis lyrata subsp. lyrata]